MPLVLFWSGGGAADPPHAVRAVHRVPGAPPGTAAERQRRAGGRGGPARLHPGAHQAAGLLLQVKPQQRKSNVLLKVNS